MSVEIDNNILKACLIPSNKSEFKFIEYKIDVKKLIGLCEIFNIDVYRFDNILQHKNKITQQQINEIFNNPSDNIFDNINAKITNSIEYDKELLNELLKRFDSSITEAINQQTNSIDFLKLFEDITHKKIIKQATEDNDSDESTNSKQEESTTEETKNFNSSDSDDDNQPKNQESTNQSNSIKYLILLFRELGIISKDKRTNKINPEYKKYFIKPNNPQSNQIIKPILNEPQIDFDYFEPKKTNGRIIRPLKLLKIIKEQGSKDITKKQLLDDLTSSEYIEMSKQDRQTYYYIKKGVIDDFHKWLINKYF